MSETAAPEARPRAVRPRHAASLVVWRLSARGPEVLMGHRGATARFQPNRLVFPGGALDKADLTAPCATPLPAEALHLLARNARGAMAQGLAIAAARELEEETGLSLGHPPALDGLVYLGRAVTPPPSPIRFNARFFAVAAERVAGELGGSGELVGLRWYDMAEIRAMSGIMRPQQHTLAELETWLALSLEQRLARADAWRFTRRKLGRE